MAASSKHPSEITAEQVLDNIFVSGKERPLQKFGENAMVVYLNGMPPLTVHGATLYQFAEEASNPSSSSRTTRQLLVMLDETNEALSVLKNWDAAVREAMFKYAERSETVRERLGLNKGRKPVTQDQTDALFNSRINPEPTMKSDGTVLKPSVNVNISTEGKAVTGVYQPYGGDSDEDVSMVSEIPPSEYLACPHKMIPCDVTFAMQALVFQNGQKHCTLRIKASVIKLSKPLSDLGSTNRDEVVVGGSVFKVRKAPRIEAAAAVAAGQMSVPASVQMSVPPPLLDGVDIDKLVAGEE